jgi:hypothetical protein
LTKPEIDFEEVKKTILYHQDIAAFVKSKRDQYKAVFAFWALEDLKRKREKLNESEIERLKLLDKFLMITKENIFKDDLEISLENYSDGFVLGTLEYFARMHEAQIEFYSQYTDLVAKLEYWEKKIGIPEDETFQEYWKEAMTGIKEIKEWLESRSNEFYPILARLVNSGHYNKPIRILKVLRKEGNENSAFQILSSILQTNPILNERLLIHCSEKSVPFDEVRDQLEATMFLLAKDATDPKVKNYCKLFLRRFHKEKLK